MWFIEKKKLSILCMNKGEILFIAASLVGSKTWVILICISSLTHVNCPMHKGVVSGGTMGIVSLEIQRYSNLLNILSFPLYKKKSSNF